MDITGIHCVFSCTYLLAMQSALKLAKAQNLPTEDLEARIAKLSQTLDAFWDEDKQAYGDSLDFTTHSAHASLFAVRAGIVPEERMDAVRKHVSYSLRSLFVNGFDPSDGVYVSPPFAFYILPFAFSILPFKKAIPSRRKKTDCTAAALVGPPQRPLEGGAGFPSPSSRKSSPAFDSSAVRVQMLVDSLDS